MFNYTLRFGQVSFRFEVPLRISKGNTQAKTLPLRYGLWLRKIARTYVLLTLADTVRWEFSKKTSTSLAQTKSLCYKRAACVSPNSLRSVLLFFWRRIPWQFREKHLTAGNLFMLIYKFRWTADFDLLMFATSR